MKELVILTSSKLLKILTIVLTLLGETMYAYITCWPNIVYTITIRSKFSIKPYKRYYESLKGIDRYLRVRRHLDI